VHGDSGIRFLDFTTGKVVRTVGVGRYDGATFSPDGRILATRSGNDLNQIDLWDTASGRLLRSWRAGKGPIASMVFTDGGKTLITAGPSTLRVPRPDDHAMWFWDVSTGVELRQVPLGHTNPQQMVLSPDGTLLAGRGYGAKDPERCIHIWEAASGKEVRQITVTPKVDLPGWSTHFTALAFAPDGKTLYAGGVDGTLIGWDPRTGKEVRRIGQDIGVPFALAFAPDGKTVAAPFSSLIHLIDTASGKERFPEVGHPVRVNSGAIAADGRTVVTADFRRILLWDLVTGRELGRIVGGEYCFLTFQMTEGGRTFVTSEYDYQTRQIKALHVRELPTGKELRRLECPPSPKAFAGSSRLHPTAERWSGIATKSLSC
jgi:WD40 repeat protein